MSDQQESTLLFKGWADTSEGKTVIIPNGGHDSQQAEKHFSEKVEVHRAGTLARIAEVEAERDEARADLTAARVELARASTGVQLAPDAPEWVIAMLDRVAQGQDIRVELDNDGQNMCDWTDHDTMTEEQLEEHWLPVLETPESPREMIVDLFAAFGVKAEGV